MNREFTLDVFEFTLFDVVLVMCVSTIDCVAASLFPTDRAARLDPVMAMR